ncbi:MAG: AI-2E family transporter [Flavobacteriaceae bacterium]|nr:AI-2E family transporter [Flavobacteriaceae bacterium]
MNSKVIASGILRAIGIIIALILVLFFLYKIQSVLIYIAIASVLSLIARPFLRFLKNKLKFPNALAVIITINLFILTTFGVISMFIPLIVKQGQNISLLNTQEFQSDIKNLINQINNYFSANNIDLFKEIQTLDLTSNIQSIPSLLNSFVSMIGSFSMGLFSVLFITFFLMKDTEILHKAFLAITPDEKEERLLKSINKIKDLLSRYFIGLIIQLTILFTIYSITLLIFGIESAVVIAFLCALLNIIPYIGPMIGGVLMLTLTMTSNLDHDFQNYILPTTLYVMIGYIIAQLIDNFLSQPIIFSKSVKSHPLEIFLVIIIGGLLFGVIGMILAVPTYTAIKVILKEFLSDNTIVRSLTKQYD